MKSGYKVLWTDHALNELQATIDYLEENWTEREIKNLAFEIEKTLQLVSYNPNLFPTSGKKQKIHRVVILKLNMMYYRINKDSIEILSFFSTRQNPRKRRLK